MKEFHENGGFSNEYLYDSIVSKTRLNIYHKKLQNFSF